MYQKEIKVAKIEVKEVFNEENGSAYLEISKNNKVLEIRELDFKISFTHFKELLNFS